MTRRVTASEAKNRFGELLDEVIAEGRVEITKHGRVVAVVVAARTPRASDAPAPRPGARPRTTHMIPAELARTARVLRRPKGFDDP